MLVDWCAGESAVVPHRASSDNRDPTIDNGQRHFSALSVKETGIVKILLAVDGSESSVRATRKLVELLSSYKEVPQIDLVNVRQPLPYLGRFSGVVITRDMVQRYYEEEGEQALAPSAKVLDEAGVRYATHVLVGDVPQTIVHHAYQSECTMIYMGTRGMTAISNLVLGSVATKVLHLAEIPVVLVR